VLRTLPLLLRLLLLSRLLLRLLLLQLVQLAAPLVALSERSPARAAFAVLSRVDQLVSVTMRWELVSAAGTAPLGTSVSLSPPPSRLLLLSLSLLWSLLLRAAW